MLTPGALFKMGTEIVAGLREILVELKHVRSTIDEGLGELLEQMRVFTERLDGMSEQIDRAMAMATSVLEDESVLAEDAPPDQVLRRAAAAARKASHAGAPAPRRKPRKP